MDKKLKQKILDLTHSLFSAYIISPLENNPEWNFKLDLLRRQLNERLIKLIEEEENEE